MEIDFGIWDSTSGIGKKSETKKDVKIEKEEPKPCKPLISKIKNLKRTKKVSKKS